MRRAENLYFGLQNSCDGNDELIHKNSLGIMTAMEQLDKCTGHRDYPYRGADIWINKKHAGFYQKILPRSIYVALGSGWALTDQDRLKTQMDWAISQVNANNIVRVCPTWPQISRFFAALCIVNDFVAENTWVGKRHIGEVCILGAGTTPSMGIKMVEADFYENEKCWGKIRNELHKHRKRTAKSAAKNSQNPEELRTFVTIDSPTLNADFNEDRIGDLFGYAFSLNTDKIIFSPAFDRTRHIETLRKAYDNVAVRQFMLTAFTYYCWTQTPCIDFKPQNGKVTVDIYEDREGYIKIEFVVTDGQITGRSSPICKTPQHILDRLFNRYEVEQYCEPLKYDAMAGEYHEDSKPKPEFREVNYAKFMLYPS